MLRSDQGLAVLLGSVLNQMLSIAMTDHLRAAPGERTTAGRRYRKGLYVWEVNMRVGTIELKVRRDRDGTYQTVLFQRYQRSEKAFLLTLMQTIVQGVSMRGQSVG